MVILCTCPWWLKEDLWLVNIDLKEVEAKPRYCFSSFPVVLTVAGQRICWTFHILWANRFTTSAVKSFLCLFKTFLLCPLMILAIFGIQLSYFYSVSIEVIIERGASWKMFVNQEQKLYGYREDWTKLFLFFSYIYWCMYLNQELYYWELKPTNNSALLEKYAKRNI